MGCTAVTQCGCHWLPIQRVGEWLLLLVQGTFLFRNCCCYSTGESRLVLRSCAGLHPNPSPGQPPGYCSESATGLLLSLRARACCNDDKSMHEAESQASFLLFLLLLLCKVGLVLQHSRGQEVTEKKQLQHSPGPAPLSWSSSSWAAGCSCSCCCCCLAAAGLWTQPWSRPPRGSPGLGSPGLDRLPELLPVRLLAGPGGWPAC